MKNCCFVPLGYIPISSSMATSCRFTITGTHYRVPDEAGLTPEEAKDHFLITVADAAAIPIGALHRPCGLCNLCDEDNDGNRKYGHKDVKVINLNPDFELAFTTDGTRVQIRQTDYEPYAPLNLGSDQAEAMQLIADLLKNSEPINYRERHTDYPLEDPRSRRDFWGARLMKEEGER